MGHSEIPQSINKPSPSRAAIDNKQDNLAINDNNRIDDEEDIKSNVIKEEDMKSTTSGIPNQAQNEVITPSITHKEDNAKTDKKGEESEDSIPEIIADDPEIEKEIVSAPHQVNNEIDKPQSDRKDTKGNYEDDFDDNNCDNEIDNIVKESKPNIEEKKSIRANDPIILTKPAQSTKNIETPKDLENIAYDFDIEDFKIEPKPETKKNEFGEDLVSGLLDDLENSDEDRIIQPSLEIESKDILNPIPTKQEDPNNDIVNEINDFDIDDFNVEPLKDESDKEQKVADQIETLNKSEEYDDNENKKKYEKENSDDKVKEESGSVDGLNVAVIENDDMEKQESDNEAKEDHEKIKNLASIKENKTESISDEAVDKQNFEDEEDYEDEDDINIIQNQSNNHEAKMEKGEFENEEDIEEHHPIFRHSFDDIYLYPDNEEEEFHSIVICRPLTEFGDQDENEEESINQNDEAIVDDNNDNFLNDLPDAGVNEIDGDENKMYEDSNEINRDENEMYGDENEVYGEDDDMNIHENNENIKKYSDEETSGIQPLGARNDDEGDSDY